MNLPTWAGSLGIRDGQRFLIDPDGRPDLRVNACLASAKWRNLDEGTQRDYTYSVGVWLNFLVTLGIGWWETAEEDAQEFMFWRVTDPENDQSIQTNSFSRDLAALKKFYKWVNAQYGVFNPFEDFDPPRITRTENVKWLDPGGYGRWRDLGLRGMDLTGRSDRWWRGRNEQRDVAFCDGLYGNGLRVSEWASVTLPELPRYDRRRGYYTCELADACAKGGYGHKYWTPRSAMKGVIAYVEGARAAAVRRAQAAGRYERIGDRRLVLSTDGTESVTLEDGRGGKETKPWKDIGPRTRLRLFRRTDYGLEPVALWLNEDGLPRQGRGWEHTFDAANQRIKDLGLESFRCTAHMLRHSLALKWYAIGKLVHAARLGHLSADERADFRAQFGDTWHLVQTMLGHRMVETTKEIYLEPFRSLDVELLLAHADDFPVEAFMASVFTGHPRVRTDPLAVSG
ncbi:site-specific integrase [Streptomyces sp. NPDC058217]|uniref:site-specific integrase n=1 Tax=Streptomyces sp. NPDC058217 TaxID=3346384 RepID=UPI0036E75B5D